MAGAATRDVFTAAAWLRITDILPADPHELIGTELAATGSLTELRELQRALDVQRPGRRGHRVGVSW